MVDDHPLFAECLAYALRIQGIHSHRPTEWPLNRLRIIEQVRQHDIGVVVLGLPIAGQASGTTVIAASRATGVRVLVVAGADDREAAAVLEAAEVVFDRSRPFDDLARNLFASIVDGVAAPGNDAWAAHITTNDAGAQTASSALHSLSPSEREVLRCLMDGHTVDEIAAASARSIATVRSHVRAVLTKLGVNCQLAAVAVAHRAGWTPGSHVSGA